MTRAQFFSLTFHRDTGAIFGALVFFWLTISLYVDSHYKVQDLEVSSGTLVSIDSLIVKKIDKPLFKEITRELYLQLNSSGNRFFIKTTSNFAFIVNKLKIGDSLLIYTKPKVWGIFGIKREGEICHLIKQQAVLVNFSDFRNQINGMFFFTLALGVFFLLFFIVRFNKRYYREVGYLRLKDH